jgi:NOL1/NOP2/sun family putative RNA methylase
MDDALARYEPLLDDYEAFREACERPLPHLVRVNTLKTTVTRAIEALREEGIGVERRDWHGALLEVDTDAPGNTWPYFLGWLHGQEEVSAIPPVVLDPDSGDRVLDTCAAPGSKTGQLAALMDDRGRILANDANLGRLAPLRSNVERLGVTNVAVTNRDARHLTFDGWEFDAVDAALVDAPCSGEGTIRKNPTALKDWSEGFLTDVSALQRDILKRAIRLTRPGGTVVYSTCTFAPEENEAVLDAILESEDCELRAFDLPLASDPGVTEWRGETYTERVGRAKRVWPHRSNTGGFFCAKLEVTA